MTDTIGNDKITLVDLVRKYCEEKNLDYRKHLFIDIDDKSWSNLDNIEYFDLISMLPGSEILLLYDSGVNRRFDRTINFIRLYSYKNYYIIFKFNFFIDNKDNNNACTYFLDHFPNKMDCSDMIDGDFEKDKINFKKFYDTCFEVCKKEEFNYKEFLLNNKSYNLNGELIDSEYNIKYLIKLSKIISIDISELVKLFL